jgi:glycosyltransferase involved in cell wall biosynthesis
MVSIIIPAYNEAVRIAPVIRIAKQHKDVVEVLVIDDGSTDGTAEIAKDAGAIVFRQPQNRGKAEAMDVGVAQAQFEYILFLDADIYGVDLETLEQMIRPVLTQKCSMFVALRSRKIALLNTLIHYMPIIGGERCLTKTLWYQVPQKYRKGFQIEIALNYFAKQTPFKMKHELAHSKKMNHFSKETKRGFFRGFWARISMIGEILWISFRLYVLKTIFNV